LKINRKICALHAIPVLKHASFRKLCDDVTNTGLLRALKSDVHKESFSIGPAANVSICNCTGKSPLYTHNLYNQPGVFGSIIVQVTAGEQC